jgi:hypothetical protein
MFCWSGTPRQDEAATPAGWLWFPQQYAKPSLPKVLIGGQRRSQSTLLHHRERHTINETPFFVGSSAVELKSTGKQIFGQGNNLDVGVLL